MASEDGLHNLFGLLGGASGNYTLGDSNSSAPNGPGNSGSSSSSTAAAGAPPTGSNIPNIPAAPALIPGPGMIAHL
jgi:hypothetical protein